MPVVRAVLRSACLAVALVLAVPAGAASAAPSGMTAVSPHNPHESGLDQAFFESCVAEINRVQVDLWVGTSPTPYTVPTHTGRDSRCHDLGWTGIFEPSTQIFEFSAGFGGPNIASSGWDCAHSSVSYAVYGLYLDPNAQPVQAYWVYLGGAGMYGRLSGGTCVYDVSSFASWGTNSVRASSAAGFHHYVMATHSWSHDDPAVGHHNDLCPDPKSCLWNSRVSVTRLA